MLLFNVKRQLLRKLNRSSCLFYFVIMLRLSWFAVIVRSRRRRPSFGWYIATLRRWLSHHEIRSVIILSSVNIRAIILLLRLPETPVLKIIIPVLVLVKFPHSLFILPLLIQPV